MSVSLSSLITPSTRDDVMTSMLGVLQSYGFPTTAWQPGGTDITQLEAFATAVSDFCAGYVPTIAAAGFIDYATGDSLRLLAQELYNIAFNAATRTVGNITLTMASTGTARTIAAGQIIVAFPSGNRYSNTTGGTLSPSGSVTLSFQSEFANDSANGLNYNDQSNQALTLVTAIAGVTATNPAGTYSSVAVQGSGTGTLTLSGTPSSFHQLVVRIDATGDSGAASWSWSLDGAPYVSAGAASSLTNIGGSGINVALTNGSLSPNFVQGTTYTVFCPGSWITQQGTDIESDSSLAARCRARWPSLSVIPTQNVYALWALSTPNAGVSQVQVLADSVVPNKVNIVVAGPAGALPPASIAAVQSYVNARAPLTDFPYVVTPTPLTITLGGTITVSVNQLAAAQAAISTAVTNYLDDVGTNGTIRLAALIDVVMNVAGVIDCTGLTINGVAANLVLGSSTSFVIPASTWTNSFTWATQ